MHNPIAFVIPAYNEAGTLKRVADDFSPLWTAWGAFVLYVNDGSTDATLSILQSLARKNPRIGYINLSRNFGKELALAAGLSVIPDGHDIVVMDADGQHTPKAVEQILADASANVDMDFVFGVRASRAYQSPKDRLLSRFFYWSMKSFLDTKLDPRIGDFFYARADAVSVLKRFQDKRLFFKGIYGWIGFSAAMTEVDIAPRVGGTSYYSFLRKLSLTIDGVMSLTRRPLQYVAAAGVFLLMLSLLMITAIIIQWLARGVVVPGYYTIISLQVMFGGLTLAAIGILAQYVGVTYENTSSRPPYIIVRERALPWLREGSDTKSSNADPQ